MSRFSCGLTLFELLVAMAVAAVILSIGIPALNGITANARRTAATNDLITAVHVARSTAIRRNRQVVICADGGAEPCTADANWSGGWLVFVNEDADHPPRLGQHDTVLYRHQAVSRLQIGSNRDYYSFYRIGLRSTNGTLTLCDSRGPVQARAVIISYTGRPRVSRTRAGGTPIQCS
ncbi:MAG: GspH/FimT family pseudopilin [Gammaproteobacteria bacterium]|nr:GspH/FimT family pseudopilin [Gammaproteobacteria bacterium]